MARERCRKFSPFDKLINLFFPALRSSGKVCVARLVESQPQRLRPNSVSEGFLQLDNKGLQSTYHDDNLGIWPLAMNTLDYLRKSINVRLRRDIVCLVVIIGADVNNNKVSRRMFAEIPRLGVI